MRLQEFKAPHVIVFLVFSASMVFYSFSNYFEARSISKSSDDQSDQDGRTFKQLMRTVSMSDNRVLVTILEREWARRGSIFDIFLESFRVGHGIQQFLNHILVFTLDSSTHEYCKSLHSHCFNIATYRSNSTWEPFKNQNHPRLGWRNVDLLGDILELGYNVLFTETDVLWLRNPFSQIKPTTEVTTGLENVQRKISDLGLFYVKSNKRTVEFFKYWKLSGTLYPYASSKSVFEIIKEDSYSEEIGLQISYFDKHFFNSFCELPGYSSTICTLHAQCYGNSERKVDTLRQIVDFMKNSSKPS